MREVRPSWMVDLRFEVKGFVQITEFELGTPSLHFPTTDLAKLKAPANTSMPLVGSTTIEAASRKETHL